MLVGRYLGVLLCVHFSCSSANDLFVVILLPRWLAFFCFYMLLGRQVDHVLINCELEDPLSDQKTVRGRFSTFLVSEDASSDFKNAILVTVEVFRSARKRLEIERRSICHK